MGVLVIIIILGTVAGLAIRYLKNYLASKASNAIENAITEHKNKTESSKSENLADRYKDSDK